MKPQDAPAPLPANVAGLVAKAISLRKGLEDTKKLRDALAEVGEDWKAKIRLKPTYEDPGLSLPPPWARSENVWNRTVAEAERVITLALPDWKVGLTARPPLDNPERKVAGDEDITDGETRYEYRSKHYQAFSIVIPQVDLAIAEMQRRHDEVYRLIQHMPEAQLVR